jgi:hypothetical protein
MTRGGANFQNHVPKLHFPRKVITVKYSWAEKKQAPLGVLKTRFFGSLIYCFSLLKGTHISRWAANKRFEKKGLFRGIF